MSHAYSYGHLTYYTAWLKANYPEEFYCSIISCEDDVEMQRTYMEDANNRGIKVLPPDINESNDTFGLNRNNDIIYGFSGIKGIGSTAYKQLLELRPFTSLSDFLLKSHLVGTKINKKAIDALIMSGALDCFGYKRSVMMRSYAKYMLDFDPKDALKKECALNKGLTSDAIKAIEEFSKRETGYFVDHSFKEYSLLEILEAEKNLIGVYISGNPMDVILKSVNERHFSSDEIKNIVSTKGSFSGCVICSVSSVRPITTKTGKKMAFIECTDIDGNSFSITAFDPVYTQNADSFKSGKYLQCYISGKPSYKGNGAIDCIVNSVINLSDAALDAAEEEKVTSVKEAYITLEGLPTKVRFKSILSKIDSIKSESKYDEGSNIFIVIKNNKNEYILIDNTKPSAYCEFIFGPFHVKPIDIDILRDLNKIPEITISTR